MDVTPTKVFPQRSYEEARLKARQAGLCASAPSTMSKRKVGGYVTTSDEEDDPAPVVERNSSTAVVDNCLKGKERVPVIAGPSTRLSRHHSLMVGCPTSASSMLFKFRSQGAQRQQQDHTKEIGHLQCQVSELSGVVNVLIKEFEEYRQAQSTCWVQAELAAAAAGPNNLPNRGASEPVTTPNLTFNHHTDTSAHAPISELSVLSDIVASYQHRSLSAKPTIPESNQVQVGPDLEMTDVAGKAWRMKKRARKANWQE
ncbi:hypothetical protein FRC10_005037 [Ceratobasidium sp. 414]|nr:hypothetical protein FRC10_005037 [Ceratobasidium sp. 414]